MIQGLDKLLESSGHSGLTELRGMVEQLLGGAETAGKLVQQTGLQSLHSRVHRLCFEVNGHLRSMVIKRLDPGIARRTQLVSSSWLPAVGLTDHGPILLGAAAEAAGKCTWHAYEDFGDWALEAKSASLPAIRASVDVISKLHVRFSDHPLLAECRLHGGDLGMNFFAANVRDALRCLESLRQTGTEMTAERAGLVNRLLERLNTLREEQPERGRALEELGGPETLLHGDLWTSNTFVIPTGDGLHARLIDWDHAGVGPVSYDLSTFLLRFPRERRLDVLECYREAVAPAGWRLPPSRDLNFLFATAEYARFANRVIWPALALVRERADWGFDSLAEVEQWFDELDPVLPEESAVIPAQPLIH
jgi:hypothetical protein